MKEFVLKNKDKMIIGLLIITIILQVALRIQYGKEKPYLHIDEGYSYGLMNYDKVDIMNNDDFYNNWHQNKYYEDYLTISKEEANDFTPVYENQKNDVHPPLFYLLLRGAASFTIDNFSKWTGIGLNLIIFIITSIMIYLVANKIFKNKLYAILVVLINGFTLASIDTTIFIRMYALNALNLLIISYLHIINLNKQELKIKDLLIMSVFIILGSLTHYHYLVFLFILYVIYMIKFIKSRNVKNAVKYTGLMIVSAIISLCIFPYSFVHIFMGYRGQEAISSIEKIPQMWNSLGQYLVILNNHVFNGILILILTIIAIIVIMKIAKNKKITIAFTNKEFLLILIPTLMYFTIIALISPYQETRYIMPICPLLVITVVYGLKVVLESVLSKKNTFIILNCLFIVMLFIPQVFNIELMYFYKDKTDIVGYIEEKHHVPAIYIFNKEQNRFLDDIYMFTKLDNSYILDSKLFSKEKIREVFSGIDIKNGVIVFINGGLENDECLQTLKEELNCSSYKWIKGMNACNIYLVEK
ncbi:MAG: glycosyltransferase family 39 protein [Clostridia bacterium]|nr:glycosyltransferase family 39 protein [Clostridia bacterium]